MARVSALPCQANPSSMTSIITAYSLPLILFAGAMYYQLFVIPKSFPPSHYDVLKFERYSPVEKVKEAYEKLESEWNSALEAPDTLEILKLNTATSFHKQHIGSVWKSGGEVLLPFTRFRYAYELLANTAWKRDYDVFGIDEQLIW